ncbi:MAG TPA: transglycosylase domain-containing protein [Aggregatilineales bacterium]|nr:transglycosylase domain-containing protein [Aggregatilineales bacterium]
MSDRPEDQRSTSETGGWFVPKNALDEQQIAASRGGTPDQGSDIPMPPSIPEQEGGWRLVAPSQAQDQQPAEATPPVAATPVEGAAPAAQQAASAPLPAGAALSSEVDYSNYVPGKGFVASGSSASSNEAQMPDEHVRNQQPSTIQRAAGEGEAAPLIDDMLSGGEPQPAVARDLQPTSVQAAQPVEAQAAPAAPAAAPVPEKPVNPELVKRYADVEKSVQVLRRRYSAGTMTRSQLQDELRKLMILDEDGYWWMIGLESDRWYKYDGADWVPTPRPGKPADAQAAPAGAEPSAPAQRGRPSLGGPALAASQGTGIARTQAASPAEETGALPQRVPLTDLGATMVGSAAPRLESTLQPGQATVPSPTPRYLQRASAGKGGGGAAFDGGQTVPGGAASALTQPGASVPSPYPNRPRVGSPFVAQPEGGSGGPSKPKSIQPDYGEAPKGIMADRQRAAGCLIRLAVVGVFLSLLAGIGLVALMVFAYVSVTTQYSSKISKLPQLVAATSQSARILDKNGKQLFQINDPNLGAHLHVSLANVSPYLVAATIATEDQRFYTDPGFDPVGIARAVLANLVHGTGIEGASTITQQLTRALILDPGAAQDRSSGRKITEIIVASEVARQYSKNAILEDYLNTVYYGNLAYGIEAASQTYFAKSAKDLNVAESAFLAGLVQAPATYDPIVNRQAAMDRMDQVLPLMAKLGCIQIFPDKGPFCLSQSDINQSIVLVAKVKAAAFKPPSSNATYPHFVNYVEQQLEDKFGKDALYSSGFTVWTTIDPSVQDIADKAVKDQINALQDLHVTNGAVMAVRPADGAVLAMVGSADFNNDKIQGQFNVTLAPRQPGSSIKPFVYLTSFERDANGNYYDPATILWDVPSCFGAAPGYCPTNYDNKFHGPMSVRFALSNSINVAAVKTLQYVGIDRFKALAQRVGLAFPLTQPEDAGLPLALGGVEVPMIDMLKGYSVLANGGKKVDFYSITKVTKRNGDTGADDVVFDATDPKQHPAQQVVEPGLAYLITNMLSDNQARQFEFGNALTLPDGRPAAVKTGTTNDSRDNWTFGYTPDLVVGVWVGNSDNSPMYGTSGVTGAAPIWKTVMTGALSAKPALQFQRPPTVAQVNVCTDFGTQDSPDCATHSVDVFFQPNPPPAYNDVFKQVNVDSFTGLLANASCSDYVEARTYINVTDATALAWLNNDPQGQTWAKNHKLTLPITPPPSAACDPNAPRPVVRLTSPQPNTQVRGLIEIRGTVQVPDFNRYQIEVGTGFNATQFDIVSGPTTAQAPGDNQFLGGWDTTSKTNGPYTLRIFAVDNAGHHVQVPINVLVNNLLPTATPQPGQIIVPTMTPIVIQPGGAPGTPSTPTPIVVQPGSGPVPTNTPQLLFPPTSTPTH